MPIKKLILACILLGIFLTGLYLFEEKKLTHPLQKSITIFTLNPHLAIAAKNVTGDASMVTFGSLDNIASATANIEKSNIILSDSSFDTFPLASTLQSYKGVFATIPDMMTDTRGLYPPLTSDIPAIELIRDTLAEADPARIGTYYDNAGNYIYRLNENEKRLRVRLEKYLPMYFVTIGGDFSTLIETYNLSKYHLAHFDTLEEFDAKSNLLPSTVRYAFSTIPPPKKSSPIPIVQMPNINDDTSAWGYIRYREKCIQAFQASFDTYD